MEVNEEAGEPAIQGESKHVLLIIFFIYLCTASPHIDISVKKSKSGLATFKRVLALEADKTRLQEWLEATEEKLAQLTMKHAAMETLVMKMYKGTHHTKKDKVEDKAKEDK